MFSQFPQSVHAIDNVDASMWLTIIRRQSRQLSKTDPRLVKYIHMMKSNVVGKGFRVVPHNIETERLETIIANWEYWSKNVIDASNQWNLLNTLEWVVESLITDGEAFIYINPKFELVPIEADLIDERVTLPLNRWRLGVQCNSVGEPIAYALLQRAPDDPYGDPMASLQYKTVPAKDIIHIYDPHQYSSKRGMPWLRSVLNLVKEISEYEANVHRRNTAISLHPYFLETPDPGAADLTGKRNVASASPNTIKFGNDPSTLVPVPPRTRIVAPPRDSSYDATNQFLDRLLVKLSNGLNISYESLIGDYSNSSYSSARLSRNIDLETWSRVQNIVINKFLHPIFTRWFVHNFSHEALDSEFLYAPAYIDWAGRTWPPVDESKTAEADAKALASGTTTRSDILSRKGSTYLDYVLTLVNEQKLANKYKISEVIPNATGALPQLSFTNYTQE